jgi:hypothetical protein
MVNNPRYRIALFAGASSALLLACASSPPPEPEVPPTPPPAEKFQYPVAARGDVVDVYHGVQVPDPYRVFEDASAAATKDWVAAENALAQPFLERLPQRAWLGERLKQL